MAPIARIISRYIVGAILMKAGIDATTAASVGADPDVVVVVQAGVGLGVAVVTEGFYALARRFGWAK